MSQQGKSESENKLHSDRYAVFLDALETLYIRNNQGARITFTREWPSAAEFVFGAELIGFDTLGASDRARRTALEDEAEGRRLELADIVSTLEEKSVNKGVLQMEYVDPLVKRLGRELSLLMYSPRIVDRFIPPPPPSATPVKEEAVRRPQTSSSGAITRTVATQGAPMPSRNDSLDHIQPISLVPQASPVAPPPSSAPALPEAPPEPEIMFTAPPLAEESAPVVKPFAPQDDSQIVKPISIPKFEDLKKKTEDEGQA